MQKKAQTLNVLNYLSQKRQLSELASHRDCQTKRNSHLLDNLYWKFPTFNIVATTTKMKTFYYKYVVQLHYKELPAFILSKDESITTSEMKTLVSWLKH